MPVAAWYGAAVEAVAELGARWAQAECVVVLTGAGLSTASGIPDFRSPGGRWERYQPVTIQEFVASEAAREEYWRYKGETWQVIRKAQPNPAHHALVDFARTGRLELLVTQNVDGLHERSGFPAERLVDIHGSDSGVVCGAGISRAPTEYRIVPMRPTPNPARVRMCSTRDAVVVLPFVPVTPNTFISRSGRP